MTSYFNSYFAATTPKLVDIFMKRWVSHIECFVLTENRMSTLIPTKYKKITTWYQNTHFQTLNVQVDIIYREIKQYVQREREVILNKKKFYILLCKYTTYVKLLMSCYTCNNLIDICVVIRYIAPR